MFQTSFNALMEQPLDFQTLDTAGTGGEAGFETLCVDTGPAQKMPAP